MLAASCIIGDALPLSEDLHGKLRAWEGGPWEGYPTKGGACPDRSWVSLPGAPVAALRAPISLSASLNGSRLPTICTTGGHRYSANSGTHNNGTHYGFGIYCADFNSGGCLP